MKKLALLVVVLAALSCGGSNGSGFTLIDPDLITVEAGTPAGTTGAQMHAAAPGEQVGNIDDKGAIFQGDPTAATLLSAPGYEDIILWTTDGSQQGGRGFPIGAPASGGVLNDPYHALLWKGTTASVVELHPAGFLNSHVLDVDGDQQVGAGRGFIDGPTQPLLWSGSAASVVNLLPSGAEAGFVNAVRNGVQGGSVRMTGSPIRAAIWQGTAASYESKHPAGFETSSIFDISSRDMVGNGRPNGSGPTEQHALLWVDGKVVDLHPPGKHGSTALVSNGDIQVGYFYDDDSLVSKACMWQGSAATFIDLSALLPSGPAYLDSRATGIADGAIYGFGFPSIGDESHAVIWHLP